MPLPVEREYLLNMLDAALASVNGRQVVSKFLSKTSHVGCPQAVLAIGKAAFAMFEGACDVLQQNMATGLLITRDGYLGNPKHLPNTECLLAGHPVPDERSLKAGERLIEWLQSLPKDMPLLVLISGGTSALVEHLPSSMALADLQRMNQWLLSSGLSIGAMNCIRRSVSMIKGGRLLSYVGRRPITQLLISDVPDDNPAVIGSGLFVPDKHFSPDIPELPNWIQDLQQEASRAINKQHGQQPDVTTMIVANNQIACEAARQQAIVYGYRATIVTTRLQGDVEDCANEIIAYLEHAEKGCYLWGGETSVQLPERPGRGGRNQQLALILALKIQSRPGYYILCAGTDGTDGNTEDAGAIVDAGTIRRYANEMLNQDSTAENILRQADAGSLLEITGDLINTGPTGTNVMDVVIALKV